MSGPFQNIDEASLGLAQAGYLPSREIATAVFLADRLEKPVLVEGPAGVGKTDLARAIAEARGLPLVRLQCYEGLDEAKALYEWEYAKQLLYTQLLRDKIGETLVGAASLGEAAERIAKSDAVVFSERFLLPRPILKAVTSDVPVLLLVDEIDKADPEFEAFLLEVLQDFAVTVPELGTFRAKHVPHVVLTSNAARELSDALKRRCLHLYVDYPDRERELRILRSRLPGLTEAFGKAIVLAVASLRALDLKKAPSIAESLDWARALLLLGADSLDPKLVSETLSLLLKHEQDVTRAREALPEIALAASKAAS
ncbi:MAG: AAA family ATPase [Deltaproteobacteria bacterium]